ncbi:unnamed protein product, partial [Brassica rapa subsp. narinosa]
MADHCMVIPGEWTSAGELWEFVIDKKKMSRIVPIHPGVSLSELRDNVAKEFYTFTVPALPSTLSYWPPNSKELATGLTTPPIIMTNDGAISYLVHHLAINPTMNLFVTFDAKGEQPQQSQVAENPHPLVTPNQPIKPNFNPFRPLSSTSSKIPSFSLFDEDELLEETPLHPTNENIPPYSDGTSPPPGPSKRTRVSIQDETLSCGDEMLEQMFNEDPDNIPEDWQLDDEDDTEPETSDPLETVPLSGFDHEFWEPLIGENLGGSDAAEVMAGLHVPKTAPETYQSTTGSVFDHTVRLSGEDDTYWKRDLDFLGVHQKERPPGQSNPTYTRAQKDQPHTPYSRGHSDTPYTRTPTGTPYTPHVGVHPRTPYTQTRRGETSP